jgi:hypothetical protein
MIESPLNQLKCLQCNWSGYSDEVAWDSVDTCMGSDKIETCPKCGSLEVYPKDSYHFKNRSQQIIE